jgi:exopolyphosphatase/guanosine-5'-triphosphate,3'-diphosphate pyrophosphatase
MDSDSRTNRASVPGKMDQAGSTSRDVIAALDLGSNTIKMTLGRLGDDGQLIEFGWASDTVRLGAGVAATGRLADDRVAAAVSALRRFADAARAQGANHLIGVATEATRTASNGPAFLARVREEIGWEIQSISGAEEAELTFRGLSRTIDTSGRIVVADIGGGSTELIVAIDGMVTFSHSYPVGSGTLTDRHVAGDPPSDDEIAACRTDADRALAPADLPTDGLLRLVAIGGTGTYLAQLLGQPASITQPEIARALAELTHVSAADLATRLTIPEARAHVLPAGIAVVQTLAARLGEPVIEVGPSGIRTGLLLSALDPVSTTQ